MQKLVELRDTINAGDYTTSGENYLADGLIELINYLLDDSPKVLYYPTGVSIVNGETKDNHIIAREMLMAMRSGTLCDLALPTGWVLKPLSIVVDTKEVPND